MDHNSVAKSVREQKERHPERFCHIKRCLWRVVTRNGIKPCPNHPTCIECGRAAYVDGDGELHDRCYVCYRDFLADMAESQENQ